ncbi:MAG: WXG100 family type VII secretion target [Clostridiales bacterium]|nr:WXG100 family type VII secretion target [Clostridiales bacterium]
MAVEGISISLAEVNATAGTIRTLNTSLKTDLDNIKAQINGLTESWQSDSATTIQSKIDGMQVHFEEYQKVIESYAKFLEDTVTAYQQTEGTINSNAGAFQ